MRGGVLTLLDASRLGIGVLVRGRSVGAVSLCVVIDTRDDQVVALPFLFFTTIQCFRVYACEDGFVSSRISEQ